MRLLSLLTDAGYIAALLTLATFFMRDDVRLRQAALATNVAYVVYGLTGHIWLPAILHGLSFPLNARRLWQLLHERRMIEHAMDVSDVSAEWLLRFMQRSNYGPNTVIFRRGDAADRMFFIAEGCVALEEIGVELGPGTLLGEIGLFSPAGARTQTAVARTRCELYAIGRAEVLALYRRNPGFGIYMIRLITRRLVEDVALEHAAAAPALSSLGAPAD